MKELHKKTQAITKLVLKAAEKARQETGAEPEPELTKPIQWPVQCIVGPGLEGAIACESKIGYVNGTRGWLIYRGYNIFDLCAYSTFEEVAYLLLHGSLPTVSQLDTFNKKLIQCRDLNEPMRLMLNFPLEQLNPMAALRLGTNLMRQEFTQADQFGYSGATTKQISSDEDSIPMETPPRGEESAIYEFKTKEDVKENTGAAESVSAVGFGSCYHLIAGLATITAAVARIRQKHLPIEPNPNLSHAANLLYMMTGKKPTPEEERIMDIALILHADHGINASTFASLVVASTLSDIYLSVGSGIAALNGPLHGGANEQVIHMLREIGAAANVVPWFEKAATEKRRVPGFGHRVYKAYDPRARVLSPLAEYLAGNNPEASSLFETAQALEKVVIARLGVQKKVFPNVDFYSGIVYYSLGIPPELFTCLFAVSRVAGWTARVMEYLKNNRIFRPRAMYTGPFNKEYIHIEERKGDGA